MSTVDEIKARIDIVDLVSETVQLRRSGKNYTGFCPFHSNSRTPAFVVFPDTGTWRCFGQCNEGGDIFGFVMKKEGWDFGEALSYLAERAGVELKPFTPQEQAAAEENDNLRLLLEEAVTYYRHQLVNSPAGRKVLTYLRQQRGLSDETIEVFGLGYAPDAWEAGLNHFTSKGFTQEDLLACGLATEREAGSGAAGPGVYDRFRNRIMFPIRDERGRMAGFGARIVDPQDVPKFLNSPQTALFDKGSLLYGLEKARKAVRSQDQAVIVEGYLDVIALHQAGYTNVVSPMGTALTETQLRLLKRFTHRIVLALDSDAAGDKATLRGFQVARQALDRESDPVFDARGLLGNEARLQADIRVTTLPGGVDPDEVVRDNPAEWERIISEARPIVVHVMETLAAGRDLDDPKVKTEIARQVLPLIEDVASPIERDTYRQRLARMLHVDERVLLESTAVTSSRTRARPQQPRTGRRPAPMGSPVAETSAPIQVAIDPQEAYCLSVLLRRPDLLNRIDRALQENHLVRLSYDDFQSADYQTLFKLVQDSLKQDHAEPLFYVQNSLSLPLMEVADRLLVRTQRVNGSDERILEDLMRALLNLRLKRVRQQIDHVRFLMEEAQAAGDARASEYQQTMVQYSVTLARLHQALSHYTSHMSQ
jgi:DNA primase